MLWLILFAAVFIAFLIAVIFITISISKFSIIKKITGGRKVLGFIVSFMMISAVMTALVFLTTIINAVIIFLHYILFLLIFRFFAWILSKITKKENVFRLKDLLAIISCTVYLVIAFILCNNVWLKQYDLSTDKQVGELKVAFIADSHVGTTFDGERFAEHMKKIEAHSPDILVISGDFVDDGTKREDMVRACQALGQFKAPYGVWFVYGNHDRGYFRDTETGFTDAELRAELEKNNVHVLVDDYELVDDRFYVVGREDEDAGGRLEINELLNGLDTSKYILVLDHQPTDFASEAESDADLVLCGHTHGGQIVPIGLVNLFAHFNDRSYGYEKRKNTEFIVTSGISDWEMLFKSGTKSEYVIINISEYGR